MTATLNVSVEFGIEPNTHAVGEIYCSDGTYITPTLNWETGECTAIDLGGKTPIGIVVVPGSHTPDGTARIMSLLECDLANPSTPTTTHNTIYWGGSGNIGITITGFPRLSGDYGPGYAGTKWSYNYMITLNSTTGLYYGNSSYQLKSPYLSDGVNQDTSSMNSWEYSHGKSNTSSMINNAHADTNWRTGSITNSKGSGYYPAACACYRYITPGTNEGDWYFPTAGELVYVIYYIKLFQSILIKLNELSSGSAVEIDTSGYYWSSSPSGYNYSYSINFTDGRVSSDLSKETNLRVRPFLAVGPEQV